MAAIRHDLFFICCHERHCLCLCLCFLSSFVPVLSHLLTYHTWALPYHVMYLLSLRMQHTRKARASQEYMDCVLTFFILFALLSRQGSYRSRFSEQLHCRSRFINLVHIFHLHRKCIPFLSLYHVDVDKGSNLSGCLSKSLTAKSFNQWDCSVASCFAINLQTGPIADCIALLGRRDGQRIRWEVTGR